MSKGLITTGLVVFLVVALFPFWYGLASGGATKPPLDKAEGRGHTNCVRELDWMRANHMDLLNTWRDEVVRRGDTTKVTIKGEAEPFEKSLSRTCLGCHTSRDDFCTKCHDYSGVAPVCWDCHNEPGGE